MLFHYNLGRPQRHPLPRPLPFAPCHFWGLIHRRTLCGRDFGVPASSQGALAPTCCQLVTMQSCR
jgi:hypothetical protein